MTYLQARSMTYSRRMRRGAARAAGLLALAALPA